MSEPPVCPYCNGPSAFMPTSASLYNGHNFGPVYACLPCQAWVGCHPNTANPLGRLANRELRRAKRAARAAFDPLWKAKIERDGIPHGEARARGYGWLAQQLGVARKDCHIGLFDVEQCRRVVDVCETYKQRQVA